MVRINLLPAEIIERRKYEAYYPYVFIFGAIALAIIVFAWLGVQLLVGQRQEELQQTEETVRILERQAQALEIFEQQREVLATRQETVNVALAGRVDLGKILEEISLVLPDNVWIQDLTLNQDSGAVIGGLTPDTAEEPTVSESYKSLAATLVRLNSLNDLYDVWLTVASSDLFSDFQGTGDQEIVPTPVVDFEMTAKIRRPQQTAVPAPPTTAGQ